MASMGADVAVPLTKEHLSPGGSPNEDQNFMSVLDISTECGHNTVHYYGQRVSATEKEVVEFTYTQMAPRPRRYACHFCNTECATEMDLLEHETIHKKPVSENVMLGMLAGAVLGANVGPSYAVAGALIGSTVGFLSSHYRGRKGPA